MQHFLLEEQARLVMGTIFYVYGFLSTPVSNTHGRMSVLRMKFKSYETEDFLAGAVKVPVEVAV